MASAMVRFASLLGEGERPYLITLRVFITLWDVKEATQRAGNGVPDVVFCRLWYIMVGRVTSSGFVRVLENLESPGISFCHFPGLESPGKWPRVLESPGNLN